MHARNSALLPFPCADTALNCAGDDLCCGKLSHLLANRS